MPKIVSDYDKEIIKTALLDKGEQFIRRKGIKSTTVDDITRAANIGKGSFYAFFQSKEELFWDIIKRNEKRAVEKMIAILSKKGVLKEKIVRFLTEEYCKPDDLRFYLSMSDFEYLTRKLSPDVLVDEDKRLGNVFVTFMSLCGINETDRNMDVLVNLFNLLTFICTSDMSKNKQSQDTTLKIIINTIAEYIVTGEC